MLGGLGAAVQTACLPQAFARKVKTARLGIHSLARQDWPPAIVPDHVAFLDKGLSCFADQFGRIAIIDLRKAVSPRVVGELSLPGKKVVDFAAVRQRAYLISVQETSNDPQYVLTTLSLAPPTDPSVLSRFTLNHFSEASCLAATAELICVGGLTTRGTNEVAIFATRGKSNEPSFITSFETSAPVTGLDLQDRHLVVIGSAGNTVIDYVNLFYPQDPQVRKTFKLDGDFHVMTRSGNLLMVIGQTASKATLEAKTIVLEPTPHAMESQPVEDLTGVFAAASQRDRFYVVGERHGDRQLVEYIMGKDLKLSPGQSLTLPGSKVAIGASCALAALGRSINIASGWQGVDVLSLEKDGWRHSFTYTIPRFPASAVAIWNDMVVLAGADLKLYDISKPDRPVLTETTESGGTIKSLATAGVFVLCLNKNALLLRRVDNLGSVIAQIQLTGQDMSLDRKNQKAYVLASDEKKTTITPVKAYSNKLVPEQSFDLPAGYRRIIASDNSLLLCGLKDIALYQAGTTPTLLGKQSLDGFAIRDAAFSDELIVVTSVDKESKGYLFVLYRDGKELGRVGAIDLPQDGVAVAVSGKQAVVVGKSPEGKDLATVIDLSVPAIPKVVASLPSIEASSAVLIKDNLAIVAGRGLEILSLG